MRIVIIDYGMGNLYSVKNAFLSLGIRATIIAKPEQLENADKAVLPGVGAFGDAMDALNAAGLTAALKKFVQAKKPLLGICLGLQLLFASSQESPGKKGLGLLDGEVVRFKGEAKIPHIGWNRMLMRKASPLLKDVDNQSFAYFCHSYYVKPKQKKTVICETDYIKKFASIVADKNVFGIQFHPEKSQAIGLKILENFAKLC